MQNYKKKPNVQKLFPQNRFLLQITFAFCRFAQKIYRHTMKKLGLMALLLILIGGSFAQTVKDKKSIREMANKVDSAALETPTMDQIVDTIPLLDVPMASDTTVIPGRQESSDSIVTGDSITLQEEVLPRMKDTLRIDTLMQQKMAKKKVSKKVTLPSPYIIRFNKFVADFRKDYNAALERWDDIYLIIKGIKANPDYFKLYVPATYYMEVPEQAYGIENWKPVIPFLKKDTRQDMLPPLKNLCHTVNVDRYVNRQLLSFYVEYPGLVTENEMDFADLKPLLGEKVVNENNEKTIKQLMTAPRVPKKMVQKDLLVIKPNFWLLTGNGYLQFSQNYISDNWYNGGESTKSFLAGLTFQANYDDRQKIQFENKLEWKLGFSGAPNDTLRSYQPNNDMLRISSKFGFKAFNNWFYTLSAEFKTQLFSTYETNTENMISGFFTPAELNIGLGMDYKYIKDEICNLSVLINPLNYTLYSIAKEDKVDPTKFNIKEGHRRESVWGSRLETTLKWQVFSMLLWESRLSYTTNYEKVLAEWENTFTFAINQYLSTKLFVHARFDDGVPRKEDYSYWQLQELLSFGLNYTW